MPLAAAIPFLVLIGVSLGGAVYFGAVAFRILRTMRTLPTLRDGLALAEDCAFWPSLCVVVPAHNEQAIVGTLARSLRSQDYPNIRVVFALDRCTDATDAAIRAELGDPPDERFELVSIDRCPEDWAGKVHAAHRGVADSAGAREADLLLFTDADTWFEPGAFRAGVALLTHRHLDLLSLLPTLTRGRWFERVVQPVAGFELVRRYPLDRLGRGKRIRFANGQFMLFKRDAYERVGGHEAVKDALLEDLAFAKLFAARRYRTKHAVLMSGGLFHCRMYAGWAEFRRGWKRIYTESAHREVDRLRRGARRIRLIGTLLPLAMLATLVSALLVWWLADDAPLGIGLGVAGIVGLLAFGLAAGLILRTQGLPITLVPLHPIGAWLTGSILREAAGDLRAGRKTEWGGRAYAREAR